MTHSKRDANERGILDALTDLGVWYCQMHREAGFDLLLAFRGRLYIVEIKDPAQPPSKRKPTANEGVTWGKLAYHGIPYAFCETLDDVLRIIGAA